MSFAEMLEKVGFGLVDLAAEATGISLAGAGGILHGGDADAH